MSKYFLIFCTLLFPSFAFAQEVRDGGAKPKRTLAINAKGLYGYVEYTIENHYEVKNARVTIPYQFEWADSFINSDYPTVQLSGRYGVIDTLGRMVIPAVYDYVFQVNNGLAVVDQNDKYGAVNLQGKVIVPAEYDYIGNFSAKGLAIAVKNGKWGVINSKNETVLPFDYLLTSSDDNGFMRGYLNGWKYFDQNGKPMDGSYITIDDKGHGYFLKYMVKGENILTDAKGQNILPEGYEYGSINSSGDACIVKKDSYMGLYNFAQHKLVLPAEYKRIKFTADGKYAIAGKTLIQGPYNFFDYQGNKAFGDDYQAVLQNFDDFYLVKQNGLWGLLNRSGKTIVPIGIASDRDGKALISVDERARRIAVGNNDGWDMLDFDGNVILRGYVDGAKDITTNAFPNNPFYFLGYNKLKIIKNGGVQEIIDDKGRKVFTTANGRYDEIGTLVENWPGEFIFAVKKNGKWGIYNFLTNKEIIAPVSKNQLTPQHNYATYYDYDKERSGYYSYTDGKEYRSNEYSYMEPYGKNSSLIERNHLKGIIDDHNKVIVPPTYDEIEDGPGKGTFLVVKNHVAGVIDSTQKVIIPLIYSDLSPDKQYGPLVTSNYINLYDGEGSVLLNAKGEKVLKAADYHKNNFRLTDMIFSGLKHCFAVFHPDSSMYDIVLNGRFYENVNKGLPVYLNFSEGLVAAKRNGLFGYLDKDGNEAIPFQFEEAYNFYQGVANVKKDGKYYLINRSGKKLDFINFDTVLKMAKNN